MFCSLETHIGDPAERLRAIARADAAGKNHSSVISPTLLQDWAQLAARAVFGAVFRLVADSPLIGNPVHNLIISNVPSSTSVGTIARNAWKKRQDGSPRCLRK
jgi:diacylglycerol O-acyltransferase / wax synthase